MQQLNMLQKNYCICRVSE